MLGYCQENAAKRTIIKKYIDFFYEYSILKIGNKRTAADILDRREVPYENGMESSGKMDGNGGVCDSKNPIFATYIRNMYGNQIYAL